MFAQDFMLRQVSIKGEVSNCKYHTSGHIYFTIKDAGAAMNAIMFAGSRAAGLSFHMKEGDQVIVTGSVEVYEKTGAYQLYAKKIELDGEGNLYLKFEQLKHESRLKTHMGITHISVNLGLWYECRNRIDNHDIHSAGTYHCLCYLKCLLTTVRL